ncbi:prephenate dehydrogenase [Promicromonospora panici]|uniref:prephenate dehydrogenase n=1 Tax=Promicromonospora panici TaxID=2219658 RepID=UPI00101CC8E8|nr:prephenate dehydrogenase/arogenate dehydrogenase family protein [Promicromonospora panici]
MSGSGSQSGPVGIVGLGLIGGSLARALQAAGVPVVATDPSSAEEARAAGLPVADDVAGLAVQRPEIVVLAAPLRVMRAVAAELAEALAGEPGWDPTVTDVGSVKAPVREAVTDAGLGDRYVGAHPMSGTERSGFESSSAELMQGIPWAVTCRPGDPESGVAGTDPWRLERVLRLVTGPLGGTAAVLTDKLHDEAVALVSHVPHVLANQLLGVVASAPVRDLALGLAAGSFRDGTRVGLTDPRRTEAMVTENGAWVAPVLRLAARDLERLADALDSNAPTHWFFDRPDPVRERIGRPGGTRVTGLHPGVGTGGSDVGSGGSGGSDVEVVPLTDGWPAELVSRCAVGAVVIALEDGNALLR